MRDFVIEDGELVTYLGKDAEIVIPEGVCWVGDGVFIENEYVQSVVLPKSLTWIQRFAFAKCKNLKRITIPASVTCIDQGAFSDSGLEEVVFEGKPEIRLWAFGGTPWKENELKRHGGLVRNGVLLKVDPDLIQYTIPSEVKIIGRDAFKNSKIKEIDIPVGVNKLDICAFAYSNLERISLPDTLRIIESYAFSNCINLTELTIPKSVSDIGSGAFQDLPDCVLTILNEHDDEDLFRIMDDAFAFGQIIPNIKEVRVPYGSVAMRYAMKAGLKVTTFPCGPRRFGNPKKYYYVDDMFCCVGGTLHEYFGRQEIVHVPDGVWTIGERAFEFSEVKKVYLPDSVETIDKYAFAYSKQLEEIIGEGVENIAPKAFHSCEQLKRVVFPNLKQCYDISFENCNKLCHENIIIPADTEIIEEAREPWTCGCGCCFITRTPFKKVVVPISKRFKNREKTDFSEFLLDVADEVKKEIEGTGKSYE